MAITIPTVNILSPTKLAKINPAKRKCKNLEKFQGSAHLNLLNQYRPRGTVFRELVSNTQAFRSAMENYEIRSIYADFLALQTLSSPESTLLEDFVRRNQRLALEENVTASIAPHRVNTLIDKTGKTIYLLEMPDNKRLYEAYCLLREERLGKIIPPPWVSLYQTRTKGPEEDVRIPKDQQHLDWSSVTKEFWDSRNGRKIGAFSINPRGRDVYTLPDIDSTAVWIGLSVNEEYQGQGLGRYLAYEMMRTMKEKGFGRISFLGRIFWVKIGTEIFMSPEQVTGYGGPLCGKETDEYFLFLFDLSTIDL